MKSTWIAKWNYCECNIAGLSKNQLHVKDWLSTVNRILRHFPKSHALFYASERIKKL
jgi:hypothetical protein